MWCEQEALSQPNLLTPQSNPHRASACHRRERLSRNGENDPLGERKKWDRFIDRLLLRRPLKKSQTCSLSEDLWPLTRTTKKKADLQVSFKTDTSTLGPNSKLWSYSALVALVKFKSYGFVMSIGPWLHERQTKTPWGHKELTCSVWPPIDAVNSC